MHVTEDDTILIGAPGVFNWKGTVVRFSSKSQDGSGGLSRRDVSGKSTIHKRDAMYYDTDVPNPGIFQVSSTKAFLMASISLSIQVSGRKAMTPISAMLCHPDILRELIQNIFCTLEVLHRPVVKKAKCTFLTLFLWGHQSFLPKKPLKSTTHSHQNKWESISVML